MRFKKAISPKKAIKNNKGSTVGFLSFLTGKRQAPVLDSINIGSRDFKADPYTFYARLRAEALAYRVRLPPGLSVWLITRYDDAVMV